MGLGNLVNSSVPTYAWQGPRGMQQEAGLESFNERRKDKAGPSPFSLIRDEGGWGKVGLHGQHAFYMPAIALSILHILACLFLTTNLRG